jgi:anti-sigma regulatory factor (Ser/Thr protein kinase)
VLTCRRLREDIECGGPGDGLEFVLEDFGTPAEPESLKGRALDDIRPGGLGMHLITNIMDSVEYEPLPGRNVLRLVKQLSCDAAP